MDGGALRRVVCDVIVDLDLDPVTPVRLDQRTRILLVDE